MLEQQSSNRLAIWDNLLVGVGRTPMVKLASTNGTPVYVKLEGFNPTGSLYDRATLAAELSGLVIHVHRNDPMATAFAALGALLGRSVFFCAEPGDSDFRWHARALGATELPCGPDCLRSVHVSWGEVLHTLLEEIAVDLESENLAAKVLLPAGSGEWAIPLAVPELQNLPETILGVELIPEPLAGASRSISGLPLLDPFSTALVEREVATAVEPTVIVALSDGAIQWPGREGIVNGVNQ